MYPMCHSDVFLKKFKQDCTVAIGRLKKDKLKQTVYNKLRQTPTSTFIDLMCRVKTKIRQANRYGPDL